MAASIDLDDKTGYLHVIFGPMYCGKTNALLNELLRFEVVGAPILYLNSALDNRTDQAFSTHHPLLKNSDKKIEGRKVDTLYSVYEDCKPYDVIGIDEAQFFHDLYDFVKDMVEKEGKRVIVAGLNGNFKREIFGDLIKLIPIADRVEKLSALCTLCARNRKIKDAPFSYRLTASQQEEILVGAKDEYIPLCRACYLKKCT